MTYGDRLRFIRKFRGMTQAELGAACDFGKHGHIYIAMYENGSRIPRKEKNERIAKVLKIDPKMLMWNTDYTMENIYYQMCWAYIVPCDEFTFRSIDYVLGLVQIFNDMNQSFLNGEVSKKECIETILQVGMEEK